MLIIIIMWAWSRLGVDSGRINMSDSDFDMVLVGDKMELVITDFVVLNKKEKAPPKYIVVS